MKKTIILLLVLVFATSIVFIGSGCKATASKETGASETTVTEASVAETTASEATTESGGKIKLVFANYASAEEATRDSINAIISEFEKTHPDVTIENLPIPYDQCREQYMIMAAGGNAPDIMHLISSWPHELGAMGAMLDLKTVAEPEYLADNYQGGLDIGTYKDKLFAVPLILAPDGFIYNKKLMAEAGIETVPKTIDELMSASQKIKDSLGSKGVYALGIDTAKDDHSLVAFMSWMFNFGAYPLEGGVNFDTPQMKQCFEWYRGIVEEKYNPLGIAVKEARELMAKDKIVFKLDGPFNLGIFRSLDPSLEGDAFYDKFGVTSPPISGNVQSPQVLSIVGSLGISSQSKNSKMAWEFVKFLTSSDISIEKYMVPLGAVPPLKSQLTGKFKDSFSSPWVQGFLNDVAPITRGFPYTTEYGAESQFIIGALQEAVTTNKPIGDILANTEASLQNLYKE